MSRVDWFFCAVLFAAVLFCFLAPFGSDDNNPKTKDVDLSPCKDGNYYVRGVGNDCISKVKIEGHEYLLYNYYKGCGICHSASCPCHTNNLNHINN